MAGSRCQVCDSPQRKAIETAIPVSSLRNIEKQWGISYQAINRHKQRHLQPAVARAMATRTELSAQALVQRLVDLLETCDRGMEKAEAKDDLKTLGSLIREARELTVTIGRTIGLWSDKPSTIIDARRQTVNIASLTVEELRNLAKLASGDVASAALPSP
jgi:hypothetical protein